MNIEEKKLEEFENWRKETIDLLDESKINKDEFLNINYNYLKKLSLKPFSYIDSLNKAVYNYQYYNVMAKKSNNEAQAIKNFKKKKKVYSKLINDRENFYYLKDLATLKILDLIDKNNIESYYINLKSKRLKGYIFEINVLSLDKVILHSKNIRILDRLKNMGVFDENYRSSLIDSYVNKSY